jgi:hypothetical protein
VGPKELEARLSSILTESRECGMKEQRDPVGSGTFNEGAILTQFHHHCSPKKDTVLSLINPGPFQDWLPRL